MDYLDCLLLSLTLLNASLKHYDFIKVEVAIIYVL